MGAFDLALGPLVICAWINVLLLGLELQQFTRYLAVYTNDGWRLTTLACVMFFVSTFSAVAECGGIYLYTVSHFGDIHYLLSQHWSFPAFLLSTGLCAVMAQSFLVRRIWKLSSKRIHHLVAAVLSVMIVLSMAGATWLATMVVLHPTFQERDKVSTPATIWLVTSAATDVFLASALVWHLLTIKKSTKSFHQSAINRALPRLIRSAVDTGSMTAFVAALSFASFMASKSTNVGPGISFIMPTMYGLTLFANLNMRHSGEDIHIHSTHSGGVVANVTARINQVRNTSLSKQNTSEIGDGSQVHESRLDYISKLSPIEDEEAELVSSKSSQFMTLSPGAMGPELERQEWLQERAREKREKEKDFRKDSI